MPHAAFKGQTPDEMYFGTGDTIPAQLKAERAEARIARREANLAVTCPACRDEVVVVEISPIPLS